MQITLTKARPEDVFMLHEMQLKAFKPLLDKYHDYETSPAAETPERVLSRIQGTNSVCHIISAHEKAIGMIRVRQEYPGRYHIGPLFILPEYQLKGYAQAALTAVFELYSDAEIWMLDTIMEEAKLCHLYEKMGFVQTEQRRKIQPGLTLVYYERRIIK